jgi:arsenate reductase (thioredoxin)
VVSGFGRTKTMTNRLPPAKIVFACVANAGRSQMAAALFNRDADLKRAYAVSAGTRPGESVHSEVIAAMAEVGIDISAARPQYLSTDITKDAHIVITMGCGDECPLMPGVEREDWPLDDPKDQPVEVVRRIRDEIDGRVRALIKERKWE